MLLTVGALLAIAMFTVVMRMPDLTWHPARDAELRDTYQTYQQTGVLLIKPVGTGSNYTQAPAPGKYTAAAWDDDPGSYVIASVVSRALGADSPYVGLRLAQALLVALPLIWLPLAVARLFGRARAGYALVLLPLLMALINRGTLLAGTEYGLADNVSTLRVYALYGLAASLTFLSLSLLVLCVSRKFGTGGLIALTIAFGLLAGVGNLMRALSGIPIAMAVAVLWWQNRKRLRFLWATAAAICAIGIAFAVQTVAMNTLNSARAHATGQAVSELPIAHGTWHPLYLGLAYPEPVTAGKSPFGVQWSDAFGWQVALNKNPHVVIASHEYDSYLKDAYLSVVKEHPFGVARLYLKKALFTFKEFAAMFVFAGIGIAAAARRRGATRRRLGGAIAVILPVLLYAFVPTVLVMPMLYYYSDFSASLSLLAAISLGALAWVFTSLPARLRMDERRRLAGRLPMALPQPTSGLSVIVPTRNGASTLPHTLAALSARLQVGDEIIVVENGSTDDTGKVLSQLASQWQGDARIVALASEPGLGNAIRTGVLASTCGRLLLTADDLPFGFSDLDAFTQLAGDVPVAIGSKAHPASQVERGRLRNFQSFAFRKLRNAILQSHVGDSQGTIWVDGVWARNFAYQSRESGLLWTTELVLAAEQQGIAVTEVPVVLDRQHHQVTSRFRLRDGLQAVTGFVRLAVYKDDYQDEQWLPRSTAAAAS